jgi:hypothetical protein
MKNLFLTIVVFSVLLLIGCQENSITDPIQDIGKQEIQKTDDPSVLSGTITLEGRLEIPNLPNSFLQITGQIVYIHRIELLDPIPPAPQYYVSLSLSVNADLIDPFSPTDPVWTITDKSTDVIYVSEEGIYLLDKTFPIQDRSDGMVLVCRFLVTTDGVGLNEMWLAVPEGNSNL